MSRDDRGSLVHRDAIARACFHALATAFNPLPFSSVFPRSILTCRPFFRRAPSPTSPREPFGARIPTRVSALVMTSPARVHRSIPENHAWPRFTTIAGARARHSGVASGLQTFCFGPSSGALSLSTVFSAIGLAGLLHPAAMFRTTPFRGFSLDAAAPSRRGRLAPLPLDSLALTGCPAATRSNRWLRGLVPHRAALHSQSGEAPRMLAPLFGLLAPPGTQSLAGRPDLLGSFHS